MADSGPVLRQNIRVAGACSRGYSLMAARKQRERIQEAGRERCIPKTCPSDLFPPLRPTPTSCHLIIMPSYRESIKGFIDQVRALRIQ